jgi:nitrogenase subunit NifH
MYVSHFFAGGIIMTKLRQTNKQHIITKFHNFIYNESIHFTYGHEKIKKERKKERSGMNG